MRNSKSWSTAQSRFGLPRSDPLEGFANGGGRGIWGTLYGDEGYGI